MLSCMKRNGIYALPKSNLIGTQVFFMKEVFVNKKGITIGIIIGITAFIIGIAMKMMKPFAISVTGGADGPTTVFLAGKVGSDISEILMAAGIILVAFLVFVWKAEK